MSNNKMTETTIDSSQPGQKLPGKKKAPRRQHRRSALSECVHSVYPHLRKHNHLDADGRKPISSATMRERGQFLIRCIKDLHKVRDASGRTYNLRNIANLGQRHVAHLAWIFEQRGYSAAAIQKYFSFLRALATWIGKKGMIGDAGDYLSDPARAKRIRIATKDKGWEAKGIDVDELLARVYLDDERVGTCLLLQRAFGLRPKEGWLLHADEAIKESTTNLHVVFGTKGGRPRDVPIQLPWQVDILRHAATRVNTTTGSLIPTRYKIGAWRKHFYDVCNRHGIKRDADLVPYGLRHDCGNNWFEEEAGFPSPVRSGGSIPDHYDRFKDHLARLEVARRMGHSRKQISSAYLGSWRKPRNQDTTDTSRTDPGQQNSETTTDGPEPKKEEEKI